MDQNILASELHRSARRHFPTRKVLTMHINDLWQADLADMQNLSKQNGGYKYILTVIDTFSKVGYARPIKTKTAVEVNEAFLNIVGEADAAPKNLHTDEGKEFFNSLMKKTNEKYSINHYHTFTDKKASIVERWNRTLKTNLFKRMTALNTLKWLPILPKIVSEYNAREHSTIGMAPNKVSETNSHLVLWRLKVEKVDPSPQKFKVGDSVRISRIKGIFDKGYHKFNWSEELFKVRTVKNTVPRTYLLSDLSGEDILGSFYGWELLKTKIPDYFRIEKVLATKKELGKTLIKVKWKGYDSKFNSWIDQEESVKL